MLLPSPLGTVAQQVERQVEALSVRSSILFSSTKIVDQLSLVQSTCFTHKMSQVQILYLLHMCLQLRWSEQLAHNEKVIGSNPLRHTFGVKLRHQRISFATRLSQVSTTYSSTMIQKLKWYKQLPVKQKIVSSSLT